jgi:hypothetical protein
MRLGVLSIGVSLCVLCGAGAALAKDGVRFVGIGTGITYAPGDRPSTFMRAPDDTGSDRAERTTSPLAERGAREVVGARRPRTLIGFDHLGLGGARVGLDPVSRDGWRAVSRMPRTASGGSAPLPADLQTLPQPAGDPASDGPSPVISSRGEYGGVVGLSYKIKPPPPSVERADPVLPPVPREQSK